MDRKELYEYLWCKDVISCPEGVNRIRTRNAVPPPEKPIKQNNMKKICKRCGQELPIENFAKNVRSKDGYMHICNECMSKALKAGFAAAKDHKQAESVIEIPAETVVVGTTAPDHAEVMQAIGKQNEFLAQFVPKTKEPAEKIHELTLKALELFDDEALIQALRDRGFSIINGELHKKFTL